MAQLKAAYNAGYRDNQWSVNDTLDRHANVMSCDGIHNATDKCYFVVEGGVEKSLPLSSSSESSEYAYCCLHTDQVYQSTPFIFTQYNN